MKGTVHNPKHKSCVKKCGGNVMIQAFIAASGLWPLVFFDDVTTQRSSRM